MGVTAKPEMYRTSDGREYADRAEAERHEVAVQAMQAFDEARTAVGRALAGQLRTADGHLFKFSRFGGYYYVRPGYLGQPNVWKIDFYYDTQFEFDECGEVTLLVPDRDRERGRKERAPERFRVSELYRDKHAAEAALLAANEAWVAELGAEVAALRARITGAPAEEGQP